ncbi:MAG: 4Fe-4S binding protein [Clostridia bacterium]|nr:4Fe-4S binding protein [Clostridia bacterium]
MAKITINLEACKGCGLCTTVCPLNLLSMAEKMNKKGFRPAQILEMEKCVGCASCATICPDCVIEVEK